MENSLRDRTLHDLLAAYSAPAVAPAGISGSALGGAVGAALMVKVARISERKIPAGPQREKTKTLGEKIERLRNVLEDIVDEDSEAYARLVRIRSAHSKGLETDEALERAWKTATIIPGAMGRASMVCINLAAELANIAYLSSLADLAMGAWLCLATVEASLIAVERNLEEIPDEAFRAKILGKQDFFDDRASTVERIVSTASRRQSG